MNIPCPNKIDCPDAEFPLENYSAEAPDPPILFVIPAGNGIVNFLGGGAGGPIRPPDGGPSPQSLSYSHRLGCISDPFIDNFNFGGVAPITFDVVAGSIPSWLAPNVQGPTLTLSGTPGQGQGGISSFSVMATDAIGETETRQFTPDIMGLASNPVLPAFSMNAGYASQLQSVGGAGGYTYGILSGSLPAGLTLSNTGLISGVPVVAQGQYPFTLNIRDAAGRLCTQNMSFSFNPNCTPTVAPVLETTFALAGECVIYASATDKIWLLDDGTNTMQIVNPSTGVVEHSFSVVVGASVDSMAYDSTQNRAYMVYNNAGNTQTRCAVFDVVTFATVTDILMPVTVSGGGDMKYDPIGNNIWISQGGVGNGLFVISCISFAVTSIAVPASFAGIQGIAVGGGVAVIGGTINLGGGTFHVGIWSVNSSTLVSGSVVDIAPTNDSVDAIAYSPTTGRFYASVSSHGFYSFDTSVGTLSLLAVGGTDQSGVQYHSCRQEIVGFNGFHLDNLVAYYIAFSNINTNTVLTSVSPSRFPPPGTNACFDPTRARMWFASGTTLCRFT